MTDVTLLGRILITGGIRAVTGLHIGGSPGALAIGNVDMPVIRNPVTGQPYIPGSSLKGKMRSLSEKVTGAPQNRSIGKDVRIHVAENRDQYDRYWVNPLFGVPGEVKIRRPGAHPPDRAGRAAGRRERQATPGRPHRHALHRGEMGGRH